MDTNTLKEHICQSLARSSINYLKIGLNLFKQSQNYSMADIQPIIGNIIIAIELMLKAFIAEENISLLFTNIPLELKAIFGCSQKTNPLNLKQFDIKLRSSEFNTLEFNECIALFYFFYPQHKQKLNSYFKLLSKMRNCSVHFVFPNFQGYEVYRAIFLALTIYQILNKDKNIYQVINMQDYEQFFKIYEEETINRVKLKVDKATKKAEKIEQNNCLLLEDWENRIIACPICNGDSLISGFTEIGEVGNDPYSPEYSLDFWADSFSCESCGLLLDGITELELVGIKPYIDMSDYVSNWMEEHRPSADYDWGDWDDEIAREK